jgi:Replication-relaxation
MATLHRYSVLTPRQLERLFPAFDVRNTLEQLYQNAYVERIPRPTYSHEEPKEPAYRLGTEGGRFLAEQTNTPFSSFYYWGKGDAKDRRRTQVSIFFLEHELENADVRIAFEQAAAQTDCAWELWQDGFSLRRLKSWAKVPVAVSPGKKEEVSIIPDDYAVLAGSRGRAHFIIEVDRSNETAKRWKRKIAAYKEFVRSGLFHSRYNITGPATPLRILTTTPSLARAENLKTIAETVGPAELSRLFLFAPLFQVLSQNPLTSLIWLRAGSANREELLLQQTLTSSSSDSM